MDTLATECDTEICLYHKLPFSADSIILGILDKKEQRCQNSQCQDDRKIFDGRCEKHELQPILATISCTENTLPYLQGAEYYQEAQCQRKMCQCLPGFSNNGWNCSPDVEVRLTSFHSFRTKNEVNLLKEQSVNYRLSDPVKFIMTNPSDANKLEPEIVAKLAEGFAGSSIPLKNVSTALQFSSLTGL